VKTFSVSRRIRLARNVEHRTAKITHQLLLMSTLPSVEAWAVANVYAAGGLMVRAFTCSKCDYVETCEKG